MTRIFSRRLLPHYAVLFALELCLLAILGLARDFEYGVAHADRPIPLVVSVLAVAGLIHGAASLRLIRASDRGTDRAPPLWLVVAGALALRLTLIASSPIQEDDFYRYLWDGKVSASGVDPYLFSPDEVERGTGDEGVERLVMLRDASSTTRTIFERLNHPEYATIYPPVAQAAFALVGLAVPNEWSLEAHLVALRLLLLTFDLGALLLLALILREVGAPPGLALAFGWSPLLIKEIVNSAHVDAIPSFFLALAVWSALRRRALVTGLAIGASVLSKYYAAVAFPLVLLLLWRRARAPASRGLRRPWAAPLVAGLVVFALVGLSELVFAGSAGARREVLRAFVGRWEMHDGVFLWLKWLCGAAGLDDPSRAARAGVGVALLGIVAFHAWRSVRDDDPSGMLRRLFGVLAAIFILSPVGFPWYFTWCLPFIVFAGSPVWHFLPALLPVYYMRFWVEYRSGNEDVAFFDDIVVSAEFGLFLLAWAVVRSSSRRRTLPGSTERSRPPGPDSESDRLA